jgi:hypothetical protein
MRSFCRGDKEIRGALPSLAIEVAAPIEYDPMDFVLHLFAKTCRAAIPGGTEDDATDRLPDLRPVVGQFARAILVVVEMLGLLLAIVGLASAVSTVSMLSIDMGEQRVVVGLTALIAGSVAMVQFLAMLGVPPFGRLWWRTSFWDEIGYIQRRFRDPGDSRYLPADTFLGRSRLDGRQSIVPNAIALGLLIIATAAVLSGWIQETAIETALLAVGVLSGACLLVPTLYAMVRSLAMGDAERLRGFESGFVEGLPGDIQIVRLALTRALTTAAIFATGGGAALLVLAVGGRVASSEVVLDLVVVVIGSVLARYSRLLRRGLRRREAFIQADAIERRERGDSLASRAALDLREIRFQQTMTSGWSGKISLQAIPRLPMSAEAGLNASRSLSERAWTLPEAIDRFREFIRIAATNAPVLIGIDELDKMSPENAEKFVNAIKAIFGVTNCYFLVSVSEDAVASFERRGLPFRDVFDSSFDQVMSVRHLDLAETEKLLAPRVIRMPIPFVALCYCLSAGLPRDVIRAARSMFDARRSSGEPGLQVLCRDLVQAEFEAKRDATTITLRRFHGPEAGQAAGWLGSLERHDASLESMISVSSPALPPRPGEGEAARTFDDVVRLIEELEGYWYFCATVLEVFGSLGDQDRMRQCEQAGSLENLALARREFAVSPRLAWQRISEFRTHWGLEPIAPAR